MTVVLFFLVFHTIRQTRDRAWVGGKGTYLAVQVANSAKLLLNLEGLTDLLSDTRNI